MKITFNTATGAVTGVEMTYLDTNGKEVAKGTGGGTDNNATYNSAENLLTFSYRPFILLRSRYFSVDYDKNTRKLTISEKDKDASAPYDQLPYWYSVSEPEKIDDGAGNEINNPNAGYSYVFGYNAQKELQYLRIEKEKSVGSADTATFHIDNDGNMIQDTNGIGDSFRITYDPEKDELKIERFNEDTGVSFVNSTNNPLGSSDTTLEYLYHTTGGTNPSEQTLGFDSNGKLRYYWFSDVAALVYTTTLGFTLSENGNFGNDTENSRNLKRTEYSNNLSNGYWAYDSGGLQNKRIPVKYKISGAVERSWSFDYSNINLTPAETTFYLSDVPTAYTFPSQFQHDLVRVLPRMDITHTVPLKYEPDYEYTLSLPKADKERYLKAPDAEHTHKLAELLNLPDYVAQKARIYYSYAVAEVVPDGYVRTAFDADDATATVSMTNKAIQYKIVIDKFQDGDNTQKLAGAEFVLYRYPTTAELMSGDGLALSDYRFENRLTGVEVTGRDRLLTVTADMAQFQISPEGNGAYYTFATNGNYLRSTPSGLDLASGSGTDASAQWALTASGTGWVFQNRETGKYLVCDGANFLQGTGDAATVQLWGADGKRIETLPEEAATTGILYSADDGIAMGMTTVPAQTIGGVN
ncbi:MAG: RICIN domain-containing protein, partial [Clostridia bacterium]|nr:RICIN domain-containing protein [Clostridia bacterium]